MHLHTYWYAFACANKRLADSRSRDRDDLWSESVMASTRGLAPRRSTMPSPSFCQRAQIARMAAPAPTQQKCNGFALNRPPLLSKAEPTRFQSFPSRHARRFDRVVVAEATHSQRPDRPRKDVTASVSELFPQRRESGAATAGSVRGSARSSNLQVGSLCCHRFPPQTEHRIT